LIYSFAAEDAEGAEENRIYDNNGTTIGNREVRYQSIKKPSRFYLRALCVLRG